MSAPQTFTTCAPPNELVLESGQKLGPLTIEYETYGRLNKTKSNAILLCHALSGNAHAVSRKGSDTKGWWDMMVGPGKPIDTKRFFVICSNVIGSCKGSTGPYSPKPDSDTPYGTQFPVITVGDMVSAQKHLIDHLNITELQMVVGGSMGGMQAMEWSIQYPTMVKTCVVIASTASLSPRALAFDTVGRNAITSDTNWNRGDYYSNDKPEKGLSIARMIGHITYLSEQSMDIKFGRKLQKKTDYGYNFNTDFQIESYLKYQGDKFGAEFDANSYLYLTKAIDYFDLTKKYGSMEKAFENSNAKFLVISITSDWLYPPKQSKEIVEGLMKLNKPVSYVEIDSPYGHDAFLIDNPHISTAVSNFIEYHL